MSQPRGNAMTISTAPVAPQEIWEAEFALTAQKPIDWLWRGFVSRGSITLLTSQWKAGKTTLLSMLLSRRASGGVLAGLPVQAGKSVVVSEEPVALWADRSQQLGFGNNVCFFTQPFRGFPSPQEWQALID